MQSYHNLVSDSELIEETINLLRECGNGANGDLRIAAKVVADRVLQIPDTDDAVAALIVSELIKDDGRLRLNVDGAIELAACADVESRLLHETEFVIVDVETTGAKTPPCRITEIGAYRVRGGRITDEFQTLVNPETAIPPFISQLTNITNDMVKRAPRFREIVDEWLSFAGDAVLVAHNSAFDVRFLNHEIARVFANRRMANASLCTVKLSRSVLPGLSNYRLHTVAEHFTVPIYNRHRAAGDSRATAEIFIRLLDLLRRHDVHTVADARRFRRR